MPQLDGRIALVTGAGRGIGASVARYLAAQGASVVVNDVGVAADGSGGDPTVAESVAADIRAAGGTAIANTDSVADWQGAEEMVTAAIAAFATCMWSSTTPPPSAAEDWSTWAKPISIRCWR